MCDAPTATILSNTATSKATQANTSVPAASSPSQDNSNSNPLGPSSTKINVDRNGMPSEPGKVGWEPGSSTSTTYFSASEGRGELDPKTYGQEKAGDKDAPEVRGTKVTSLRDVHVEGDIAILDKELIEFANGLGNGPQDGMEQSPDTALTRDDGETDPGLKPVRKLSTDEISQPAKRIRKVSHFEFPQTEDVDSPSLLAVGSVKEKLSLTSGQSISGKDGNAENKESPNQSSARTPRAKKGSKLKANAAPFVPSSYQRKAQRSSDTAGNASMVSGYSRSQGLQALMQQPGNIRQDTSGRRQSARSDPTGQSLKSIQDQWMRGGARQGEQAPEPERASLTQTQVAVPGPSGHMITRSVPLGGGDNRRRSRSHRKKDRSTSESTTISTSDRSGDQNNSPEPAIPATPNPTPTGILTPVEETSRATSFGVRFAPETK